MTTSSSTDTAHDMTRCATDGTIPLQAGLSVRCFGRFEVIRDGRKVLNWRRKKAETFLKHLVAHHGSIKRDVLLDLSVLSYSQVSGTRDRQIALLPSPIVIVEGVLALHIPVVRDSSTVKLWIQAPLRIAEARPNGAMGERRMASRLDSRGGLTAYPGQACGGSSRHPRATPVLRLDHR
jgi:hypothetical protein